MYCKHCGKEIADDAVICVNCGRDLGVIKQNESTKNEKWDGGIYALLIIGALIIPAIGLIMGLINIDNLAKKEQAKVLVAIGIINLILTIIFVF